MNKTFSLFLFLLINIFCTASFALEIPAFQSDVLDETNTLTASEQEALKSRIKTLREVDDVWMAVYVTNNLQETSIEDLANQTFEKWKLGQKGKDNGLLFIIIPSARKMRLEVGYGLEPIFTDGWTVGLLDQVVKPQFKQENYIGGIYLAIDKLSELKKLSNDYPELAKIKLMVSPFAYGFIQIALILFSITNVLYIVGYLIKKKKNLLKKAGEYTLGTVLATFFLSFFFAPFIEMGLTGANKLSLYIAEFFAFNLLFLPAVLYVASNFVKSPRFLNVNFGLADKKAGETLHIKIKVIVSFLKTLILFFILYQIFQYFWVAIIIAPILGIMDYFSIGKGGGSSGKWSSGSGSSGSSRSSSSSSSSGGGSSGGGGSSSSW